MTDETLATKPEKTAAKAADVQPAAAAAIPDEPTIPLKEFMEGFINDRRRELVHAFGKSMQRENILRTTQGDYQSRFDSFITKPAR